MFIEENFLLRFQVKINHLTLHIFKFDKAHHRIQQKKKTRKKNMNYLLPYFDGIFFK